METARAGSASDAVGDCTSVERKCEGVPKQKHSGAADVHSVASSLWFILAFVAVGLPIWWKTTNVYRAAIPFEGIAALEKRSITHNISISILVNDDSLQLGDLEAALNRVIAIRESNVPKSTLNFKYSWKLERAHEDIHNLIANSKNLESLEASLKELHVSRVGHLTIVLSANWPPNPRTIVGVHRTLFISRVDKDLELLSRYIVTKIVHNVVREESLKEITVGPVVEAERKRATRTKQRALKASQKLNIIVTCVVPKPEEVNVEWPRRQDYDSYLRKVFEELSDVAQISFKTQFKFGYDVSLSTRFSEDTSEHFLQPESSTLLVNQLESALSSEISVDPTLNFVVYVVPNKYTPLYAYTVKDDGEIKKHDNFFSPRWGGVMFYNVEETPRNDSEARIVEIDSARVFRVVISQLRPLLGLKTDSASAPFDTHFRAAPEQFTQWEIDLLRRKKTQEYFVGVVQTLSSLAELLTKIENMVINDEIAQLTEKAVASAENVLILLNKGDLKRALMAAEAAHGYSQKAFYDPSLLGLLYFPSDQKYAIYVPLFVPTMLPVVLSIFAMMKLLKEHFSSRQSPTGSGSMITSK